MLLYVLITMYYVAVTLVPAITGWLKYNNDLHCHVDLSLGRPPNYQWKRHPGRPREIWIEQVRKDNGGMRRIVVTEEQRYGPRWLCDNDDDDDK